MTGLASGQRGMLTGQRPAGEGMIEILFQDLVPAGGVVAGHAVVSKLTEMDVVLRMATDTIRIYRLHQILAMAVRAG